MALLQNTAINSPSEKTTDSIYTAQQIQNAPTKVSSRPVEVAPNNFSSRVASQVNNIISQGGPLLTRAKTEGINAAAERGLNNSSMGIQAAEDAVYKYALPIAQQDVDMDFKSDMQKEDQKFQAGENAANRSLQQSLQSSEFGFRSGESAMERQFNNEQSKLNREHQLTSMDKEQGFHSAQNQLSRDQQLAVMNKEQGFQAYQQDKQNQFASSQQQAAHGFQLEEIKANAHEQIRVAASQVDEKFKAQYLESASNLQRSFLDQQTAILNNPALKKDTQVTNALTVAKQNFESSVSYLQGLYSQGGVSMNTSVFPIVGPVRDSIAAVDARTQTAIQPTSARQYVMGR